MNDKKKKIYLCTSYISSVSEKEMQHPYLLEWSQCTTAMIQRLWLLIKKTASNTVKPSSSICNRLVCKSDVMNSFCICIRCDFGVVFKLQRHALTFLKGLFCAAYSHSELCTWINKIKK